MIQLKNLTKIYRTPVVETRVLSNLSLEIDQGEFVSIAGSSGCGKSTLLNLLGMIDLPDGGIYRFGSEEVAMYTERQRARLRRKHIGFLFQSFNLIEELTVFENVELPLMYAQLPVDERRQKVEEVLHQLEMFCQRDSYPLRLTCVQQQRVAMARALVNQPDMILADEPAGNLDSQAGAEVMGLLTALNRCGTTIVLVTHSPTCAKYAQRMLCLHDGRIRTKSRVFQA
jgi:putative ABC transport system ATP-binding protein